MTRNIWTNLGYFLFFLMVTFPAAPGLTPVKGCVLGIVLLAVAIGVMRDRISAHPRVAVWTFFFVLLGLFLVVRGLFLETPGAWPSVGVYVLWPIIYLMLLASVTTTKGFFEIERLLTIAAIFIPVYSFLYLASETGLVPGLGYVGLSSFREGQGFDLSEGYIQVSTYGLNSISFLFPFVVATLATYQRWPNVKRISRGWLWIALLLSVGLILISGRRAIQLITLLTPLIILVLSFWRPRAEQMSTRKFLTKVVVIGLCCALTFTFVIGLVHEVKLSQVFHELALSFDFSPTTASDSANERRNQFFALLDGWYEHPVLGIGLGMPVYGSIRSEEMPWAYELSYLALLCQTGLLGVLAYAVGIGWIYKMSGKILGAGGMAGHLMLPLITGMTGFLIANATNPYLGKFDGLWSIFLPLTLINWWLVKNPEGYLVNNFRFSKRLGQA